MKPKCQTPPAVPHSRPPLERMMRIHDALKAGRYPNCSQLAKAIEDLHSSQRILGDRLDALYRRPEPNLVEVLVSSESSAPVAIIATVPVRSMAPASTAVAPLAVLADEEADRRKLTEAQALAGTLEVRTFSLSYAQAAKLEPLIKYASLSQRGEIRFDERTNTLIVRDLPDCLAAVQSLIATLDRPEPQVEIQAQIVQTNRDAARERMIGKLSQPE